MKQENLAVVTDEPIDFNLQSYINCRIIGFTPRQAALQAGYRSHGDYMKFERDPEVVEQLQQHLKSSRKEAVYTRDKVMEVIEEGIDICRITADGVGMIRGAQEFNKMQGFYAPEQKEILHHVEGEIRIGQIQEMSEEDLLLALEKEQPYIDAEFAELPKLEDKTDETI